VNFAGFSNGKTGVLGFNEGQALNTERAKMKYKMTLAFDRNSRAFNHVMETFAREKNWRTAYFSMQRGTFRGGEEASTIDKRVWWIPEQPPWVPITDADREGWYGEGRDWTEDEDFVREEEVTEDAVREGRDWTEDEDFASEEEDEDFASEEEDEDFESEEEFVEDDVDLSE